MHFKSLYEAQSFARFLFIHVKLFASIWYELDVCRLMCCSFKVIHCSWIFTVNSGFDLQCIRLRSVYSNNLMLIQKKYWLTICDRFQMKQIKRRHLHLNTIIVSVFHTLTILYSYTKIKLHENIEKVLKWYAWEGQNGRNSPCAGAFWCWKKC